MALLSDLVRIVAAVEGLEEVSVGIFARHARESGHISQGGRGRSAAKMTFSDAANLLIAVNGCSLAKNVPSMVETIRNLPAEAAEKKNTIGLALEGATFGGDLEILLKVLSSIESGDSLLGATGPVTVSFHRPIVKAAIEICPQIAGTLIEQVAEYCDYTREYSLPEPDRYDQISITQRTLYAVARAIAD